MSHALPIFFVIAAGICLSLVLLSLWQSLRIVFARGAVSAPHAGLQKHRGRATLLHEKQELLTAIREVRAEFELGKISESDYHELEQRHRARAREVLRALEAQIAPHREHARAMLDAALAAEPSAPLAPAAPAARTQNCTACQIENDGDAVFCKKCGARLASGGDA